MQTTATTTPATTTVSTTTTTATPLPQRFLRPLLLLLLLATPIVTPTHRRFSCDARREVTVATGLWSRSGSGTTTLVVVGSAVNGGSEYTHPNPSSSSRRLQIKLTRQAGQWEKKQLWYQSHQVPHSRHQSRYSGHFLMHVDVINTMPHSHVFDGDSKSYCLPLSLWLSPALPTAPL